MGFEVVYLPVGVPTFHLESAQAAFEASREALLAVDSNVICPEEMLLSLDKLSAILEGRHPDLLIFQNVTFANAAYMAEALRRTNCPVLLWTLREPVIDGGRLRLNSLTGAYSAANTLKALGRRFEYVFGAPDEARVQSALRAIMAAARVKRQMGELTMAAVGHTPQGFGFGRALDSELLAAFGVSLVSVEARELINMAKGYGEADCDEWLDRSERATVGLQNTPERNRIDHARLYRAYRAFIDQNHIGALASRCWPDFFTDFGTPVCAVLSMLNDDGVAAACEADMYGALSMWIGMRLGGGPVFFGDPVSLDEGENTLTFWHCGAAACSLARRDTGATVGVHPNRKIGPAMDFGCEAAPRATVFRVARQPDGTFRFFILTGEALDKPKQFTGTSVVVRTDVPCRDAVTRSVLEGLEPHFAVIMGDCAEELCALARMLGMETDLNKA